MEKYIKLTTPFLNERKDSPQLPSSFILILPPSSSWKWMLQVVVLVPWYPKGFSQMFSSDDTPDEPEPGEACPTTA
ncbi:hypothetical protein ILYODFUR_034962 [Ilyodon furcidens]|uniref:Uncharacterized protein n=1 Tax=Ilyodon furcidens TaxID=33524 RepID=A0ABV0VKA6_9TELE